MKKINIFVFTIIIFLLSSISAMEQASKEFKQQFPVICLPKEILTHIFDNNNDKTESFCNYIKFFLALRSTSTYFNKFLTAKRIGQFCKIFDKKIKNKALKKILDIDEYKKLRFPSLVLIYAKANPNVIVACNTLLDRTLYNKDLLFTKILLQHKVDPNKQCDYRYPPLFYARTKKAAQLLIKYGADINIKDKHQNINILWHLMGYDYVSQKTNLNLFQFYIDKGVDPKALRPMDNSCLFHLLVKCHKRYSYKIKIAKILITKIPDLFNKINKNNKTPFDVIIYEKKCYENEINRSRIKQDFLSLNYYRKHYEDLQKISIFLEKNGAKTAQQLEEAKYQ